jgi:hypothetical protein
VARERDLRQMFISGATPEQAVEQVQVAYHNPGPAFEPMRPKRGGPSGRLVAPIARRFHPALEGCALASILNRDPRALVVAYGNPNAFRLLIDANVVAFAPNHDLMLALAPHGSMPPAAMILLMMVPSGTASNSRAATGWSRDAPSSPPC